MNTKLNKEEVLKAIYKKFDSLEQCADALGISINNLSNKFRRLSPKFIAQLEAVGVEIKTQNQSIEELKKLIDKANLEIEKLKAKLYDINEKLEGSE